MTSNHLRFVEHTTKDFQSIITKPDHRKNLAVPVGLEPIDRKLTLQNIRLMPKRSRPDPTDEEEVSIFEVPSDDGQEPDIFAALTCQKKSQIPASGGQMSDGDEDLQEIIRQATARRDVKEGTQVVKKAKGKTKITKGEVGGGSFQSMGEHNPLSVRCLLG